MARTVAELEALLAKSEARNAELEAAKSKPQVITVCLSKDEMDKQTKQRKPNTAKACISVYGLSKQFPVSLYRTQWRKLIDIAIPQVEAMLADPKANEELDRREARQRG